MGFSGRGNGFRGGWKGIRRGGGRGRGRGYGFKSSRRLAHSSWGSDEPVQAENADPKTSTTERKSLDRRKEMDFQDSNSGVEVLSAGSRPRLGWLYNMASVTVLDSISEKLVQGADLFFIGSDGADFRATAVMRPYLYLSALEDKVGELETSLLKLYPELIACCTVTYLEDLDAPNHLSMREGRPYLKVESWTMKESNDLRQMLIPFQRKNQASKKKLGVADAAELEYRAGLDLLDDIREYDVSPLNRIAIGTRRTP
uniref:DNA polymerase epsilon catalytic subunit n=1 Tax=Rhodosorus marinus TaxID=101924 RepID=A0A7S2ZRJ1_9RHOD|mmetsp:Transcript_30046/g.115354  ORF Transcript_30046/g.115354 Transcript_30046/m.115354 type:complete len:257 (+) Transcript_30046:170-940(+)